MTPDTTAPASVTPLAVLGREDILKADDLVSRELDVPEWRGRVRIRALSSEERDEFEASMWTTEPDPKDPTKMVTKRSLKNARANLVAKCLVDQAGRRLFPDEKDVVLLGRKSGKALDRCFDVALELSGLSKEAQAELGKDSGGTPPDSSSSASPDA